MKSWVFVLLLMISFSKLSFANDSNSSTQVTKNKLSDFSLNLDYKIRTNLAEENNIKVYNNEIVIGVSKNMGKILSGEWSVGLETGVSAYSENNNIQKTQDNPQTKDIELGFEYKRNLFSDSKFSTQFSESLPTGYESQLESYKSVVATELTLVTPISKSQFTCINKLDLSYIFNTYSESLNSKTTNADLISSYILGFNFKFSKLISFGINGSTTNIHFLNDENSLRLTSTEYIRLNYSSWTVSLSYLNGKYDKNDSFRFLYLDDQRQVVMLGVGLEI